MYQEQAAKRTLDLVEKWVPGDEYGHEREFQKELQAYLDDELNSSGGAFGHNQTHAVSTERGRSNGDIVVDDAIGIELKRDLSNSQIDRLKGQIDKYREEYDYVIVCACGIDDMDGWRRLQKEYSGGMGDDPMAAPVRFVHKEKSRFGKQRAEANSFGGTGGPMDGLSLGGGSSSNADVSMEDFEDLPEPLQYVVAVLMLGFIAYAAYTILLV